MNRFQKYTLITTGLLFTASLASAQTYNVVPNPDTYIGANPGGGDNFIDSEYRDWDGVDVIGYQNVFNISGWDFSATTNADGSASITIDIFSGYFDNLLKNKDLLGTQMGDLFISTDGYNPNDTNMVNAMGNTVPNTGTGLDNFGNAGEDWEYAVVFDDRSPRQGDIAGGFGNTYNGSAGLYEIVDNTNMVGTVGSPELDGLLGSNATGTYRVGQEVWYNPSSSETADQSVSWSLIPTGSNDDSKITALSSGSSTVALGTNDINPEGIGVNPPVDYSNHTDSFKDYYLSVTIDNIPTEWRATDLNGDGDSNDAGEQNGLLAFHWTMTCGNDTIEFFVIPDLPPVPEPATVGLMAAVGLFGLVYYRRRKQAKAA